MFVSLLGVKALLTNSKSLELALISFPAVINNLYLIRLIIIQDVYLIS